MIKKLFTAEKIKVYIYTLANIITLILAFFVNYFLTKYTNTESYGRYKFATNFLLTIPAFFIFGLHFSCSRLIAKYKTDEKSNIASLCVIIVSIIGIIITIILFILTLINKSLNIDFINLLQNNKIIIPFIVIFAVKLVLTQVYQGSGKIFRLSLFSTTNYIILIIGIILGKFVFNNLSFTYCILIYIFSNLIIMLPLLFKLRLNKNSIKQDLKIVYKDIKQNGIKIYLSSIATTSICALIGLICGSMYGYEEYGFYSLALSLAGFFTFISSSMTVVKFRDNVHQRFIKKADVIFMVVLNLLLYLVFYFLIDYVFFWFFDISFAPTINYLKVLAIVYILNGMTLYFNRFFVARGLSGIVLRNSLILSIITIILSTILIPKYQIFGLIIASIISSIFNFFNYLISYYKYRNKEILRK